MVGRWAGLGWLVGMVGRVTWLVMVGGVRLVSWDGR
jgi:hypothetical protein